MKMLVVITVLRLWDYTRYAIYFFEISCNSSLPFKPILKNMLVAEDHL